MPIRVDNVITDRRLAKFARVAAARQQMSVIIENVHDPHNIGAVMRTCDSVGIQELYILYTEGHLDEDRLDHVQGSATGVRKWLNVYMFRDVDACFAAVRKKYDTVLATHLDHEAKSLYELQLTGKVALLFGNEHAGLSDAALSHSDGNFIIPQMGLVQSLNISVACAVTIYEALRQRNLKGMYDENVPMTAEQQQALYDSFVDRQQNRKKGNIAVKIK